LVIAVVFVILSGIARWHQQTSWGFATALVVHTMPIPIRNMEKDILKIAGFSAFSKCAFP